VGSRSISAAASALVILSILVLASEPASAASGDGFDVLLSTGEGAAGQLDVVSIDGQGQESGRRTLARGEIRAFDGRAGVVLAVVDGVTTRFAASGGAGTPLPQVRCGWGADGMSYYQCIPIDGGKRVLRFHDIPRTLEVLRASDGAVLKGYDLSRAPSGASSGIEVGRGGRAAYFAVSRAYPKQQGWLVRVDLGRGSVRSTLATRGHGLDVGCLTRAGQLLGTEGTVVETEGLLLRDPRIVWLGSNGHVVRRGPASPDLTLSACSPSGRMAVRTTVSSSEWTIAVMDTRTGRTSTTLASGQGSRAAGLAP
jgi:hypothetical protein